MLSLGTCLIVVCLAWGLTSVVHSRPSFSMHGSPGSYPTPEALAPLVDRNIAASRNPFEEETKSENPFDVPIGEFDIQTHVGHSAKSSTNLAKALSSLPDHDISASRNPFEEKTKSKNPFDEPIEEYDLQTHIGHGAMSSTYAGDFLDLSRKSNQPVAASPLNFDGNPFAMHPGGPTGQDGTLASGNMLLPAVPHSTGFQQDAYHRAVPVVGTTHDEVLRSLQVNPEISYNPFRFDPRETEIQNRQGSWVEFDNDVKSGAPIDSVPGTSDYGSTQTGTSDQNFIARDQSHASHGPEPSGEQPLIDLGITDEEKKETSGPSLESFLQEEFYHRISSALKSRLANLTIGNRETLQEFYEEILAATLIQSAQLKNAERRHTEQELREHSEILVVYAIEQLFSTLEKPLEDLNDKTKQGLIQSLARTPPKGASRSWLPALWLTHRYEQEFSSSHVDPFQLINVLNHFKRSGKTS
ncbi:hypothetical protein Pst134EA_009863 [Puccinia striiformis f. sp. tritici]|uniref:Secreted protein n=1 Tax=Puccinia striiformis f. sp. tritici PST-78 TaxID=1165861 RepID=A0A0L0USU5_9BASI|nr:hypothetical protein Pst134EA_009863 [Puccinia striiformis f. sp. tritici]KAH9458684.1 hypothetical protein Pst134EB_010982 [Puccinia striiformis f. sp. tritici]KAH9469341.1 hypothetical protein Pst134EA_009863 [Puccinia striiformis f. sp. tritici]KAI9612159.1 hypothetical protein H4Q26_008252 [Puccinia striiformis f. sp. tritici PST-130]KNE89829.1 hypothetical protein, variant [Puccinia striiformis f. sp. tritici PST-78]